MPATPFDAPIPGQSLTSPPGSHPFEKAPQFADPNDAAEFIWGEITQPRNAIKILASLRAGVTAEYLTRTLLFIGFMNGQWTPDVCLMLGRPVLYMIVKLAHVKGLNDIKILNPDTDQQDLMKEFAKIIYSKDKQKPTQAAAIQTEAAPEAENSQVKIGMLDG